MIKPIIPQPLKKGDCVGIFAPAGYLEDINLYNQGVSILNDLGFQVKMPTRQWPGIDYLADNDQNRSEEFNRLWDDSEIKALIALRGGYGCLRILDKIDLSIVRNNPKLIIGFSDITILANYLTENTGIVTLHGPVLTSLPHQDQHSLSRFYHSFLGQWHKEICCKNLEILKGDITARGQLTGGNLSSIVSLLSTPYEPDWRNKIVFLEDVHEPMYRLDRLFTQLTLAGKFDNVAGIILGDFSLSPHQDTLEKMRLHETLWNRVIELTGTFHVPIWGGFDTGHTTRNLTLPLGVNAVMNSAQGVLEFEF